MSVVLRSVEPALNRLLQSPGCHLKQEADGRIIACAALYPFVEQSCGEVACIVSHPDYRGGRRGQRLLDALEQEARRLGLERLFVLTTQTAHWFVEQGFVEGRPDDLPGSRKDLYNWQRASQVLSKSLS